MSTYVLLLILILILVVFLLVLTINASYGFIHVYNEIVSSEYGFGLNVPYRNLEYFISNEFNRIYFAATTNCNCKYICLSQ